MKCDVLVVGAGAAGLHTALEAAEAGAAVRLVSRKVLSESASFWAQGGLAAALAADDSPDRHIEDTLNAGRGLCRREAVEVLTADAPAAVRKLIERGVPFDTTADGELSLGLEGGHSARRIVHAGGAETGRAITGRLNELVAAHPGIEIEEGTSVLGLRSDGERCHGAVTDKGSILASSTVLSTGGAAALWQRSTNPWGAIGAGSVLGHDAGADLADLEFCQFHPTALRLPSSHLDGALITEAMRGEGAILLDAGGRRFTDELAPRDQVSAAILDVIDADGRDFVMLDLRPVDMSRFPSVAATIREAGLDPTVEPVPVAPAAHYTMGGVVTDTDGRSTVAGLYAVGECSCTGLHGANRLASNSLSECFVFGSRVALAAGQDPEPDPNPPEPRGMFVPPNPPSREALWRHAGPKRDADSLKQLLDDPYPLSRMIAAAALERTESRGAHRRNDFPVSRNGMDGVHIVLGSDGALRQESWE